MVRESHYTKPLAILFTESMNALNKKKVICLLFANEKNLRGQRSTPFPAAADDGKREKND